MTREESPPAAMPIQVILRGTQFLGEFVTIEPACPDVLGRIETRSCRLVTDGRGTTIRVGTESLCPWHAVQRSYLAHRLHPYDGVAVTYPGLREAISWKLRVAGLDVAENVRATAALPAPDLARRKAGQAVNAGMLDFIRGNERGLIRYGAGVDPAVLAAEVAWAYPRSTIAIVAATKRRVRRIGRMVKRFVRDARWLVRHAWDGYDQPRVIVTLPGRLGYGTVSIEEREILLVPDALQALSPSNRDGIRRAFRAHVIGLLPRDIALSPSDWDRLRCWYGFAEYAVPAYGRRILPIDVVSAKFEAARRASRAAPPREIKRAEIWTHPIRNRWLVRLARQLRSGARRRSHSSFDRILAGPQRVVVLVETLEHAMELLPRLPGWSLLTGPVINELGLTAAQKQLLDHARRSTPANDAWISTSAGAERLDFQQVDVVLRADGGSGLPPPMRSLTLGAEAGERRLLLVDFMDRHHPVCRRWSRARHDRYARAGWHAWGVDPREPRYEQFFQSRPR